MLQPRSTTEILREAEERERRRASGDAYLNLSRRAPLSPDAAAAAERASEVLGLPAMLVEAQPALVKQAEVQRNAERLEAAPRTASFLADESNAAVAHDQVEGLSFLERVAGRLRRAPGVFGGHQRFGNQLGRDFIAGANQGLAMGLEGLGRLSTDPERDPIARFLIDAGQRGQAVAGWLRGDQESRGQIRSFARDWVPEETAQTGFAGDVAGGLGQVGGQIATGPYALPLMFGAGVSQMNERVEADMAADGRAERSAADEAALVGGGLVTAATEQLGLSRIMRLIPDSVRGTVTNRLLDIAQAGVTEGLTEMAEGLGQNALAKALLDPDTNLWDEGLVYEGGVGATVGAIARTVITAAIPGRQFAVDTERAQAATENARVFDQMAEAVQGNPLLSRVPERLRNFLVGVTEQETVFIPGKVAATFFQSNPDLDSWMDEWDIRDQVQQAMVAGTEVEMPLATYLTKVMPQAQADAAFRNDLKIGVGAMSLREAEVFEQEGEADLQEAIGQAIQTAEQETSAANPGERVRADVFQQLRNAGFSDAVARQNATLAQERYITRAERSPELYGDAWEAYRASNVRFQQELPASVRAVRDRLDVVIETMRRGTEGPSHRSLRGPSLLEFVSEAGGITDAGGELTQMGVQQWSNPRTSGRTGRRRVIRSREDQNNAYGADTVLARAVEAGYLREDATVNDLYEAMRGEVAGSPLFSQAFATENRVEETLQAATDLREMLAETGIDPATATNEQIREVVERVSEAEGRGYAQDRRGRIDFADDGAVISFFKAKDRSTFLHETGHLWLDELIQDASVDGASAEVQADLQTVLDWFSKEAGETITADKIGTEQHELWARGMERFYLEGVAPSVELRSPFMRFTQWLKRIYRSVEALRSPVSDPVRGVMARLVATDDQIQASREAQALNRLFTDAESAGMTKEEFARYTAADNAALDNAEARAMKRAMEPLRREAMESMKAEREGMREEQAAKIDALPDIAALRVLSETGQKLDRQALIDIYGSDGVLKLLPNKRPAIYAKDGTMHPDLLAEMVGAQSGEALLNDLMAHEAERLRRKEQGDNRSVRDARIEDSLDAVMAFLHGDPLNDGTLEEIALHAVHEKAKADALTTEANQLAKLAGRQTLWTREAVEAYARQTILDLKTSRIRPGTYLRAERSAGIRAQRALLKGNHSDALEAKLLQTVNFHLYREAVAAQEAIDKSDKLFSRVLSAPDKASKSRNFEMVQAARSILADYGLTNRRSVSARDYLAALKEYEPDAWMALNDVVNEATENAQPIDDLSFADRMDLNETIVQLWTMARQSRVAVIEGKRIEIETVQGELAADLAALGPRPESRGKRHAVTDSERNMNAWLSGWTVFLKVEEWALRKGQNFHRYVYRPISDAATAYRTLQREHMPRLEEALKTLAPDSRKNVKIDAREIDYVFGEGKANGVLEFLGAMRHMGNPSNYRKLILGRGWGSLNPDGSLNDSAFQALLTRLQQTGVIQKRHWDYVQAEWDLHEEVKPHVQRAHKHLTGRYFDEITAQPIETPFGTYAGGYVPAKVDAAIDERMAELDVQATLAGDLGGSFAWPMAGNGFTKRRVENYNRPLDLDVRKALNQFDESMKYATLGPAVQDANRILKGRDFAELLNDYDRGVWNNLLNPWLKRSASQRVSTSSTNEGLKRVEDFLGAVTSRTSTAIMFANVVNVAQQGVDVFTAAAETGKGNLAAALRDSIRDREGMTQAVINSSPFMATRMSEQMRDLSDTAREIVIAPGPYGRAAEWSDRHRYFMQKGLQNFTDPIIWTAAYNKAVKRGDENPVAFADSTIRRVVDSYFPEDSTLFASGPKILAPFKMFTGYFLTRANYLITEGKTAKREHDIGRMGELYVLGMLIPSVGAEIVAQAIRGSLGDEEDDGWWDDLFDIVILSQLRYASAMIPIAGQLANQFINSFDDKFYNDRLSLSPVLTMGEAMGRTVTNAIDLAMGDGDWSRTVRDMSTTVTVLTGIPLMQRQTGYVADVLEGDVEPTGYVDAARGFVSGVASEESRVD